MVKENNEVSAPFHYTEGGLEVIDILEAKLPAAEFEGFLIGNILKYVFRHKLKNGTTDLKKAKWYLDRLLSTPDKK